ncbi:MAG: LysR family transcriptional regulator, partial [Tabrizicola sp.]|nr:LysR family transcriptional regulator [Tabrizicola sp.]
VPTGFAPLLAKALARLQDRVPGLAVEVISGSTPTDLLAGEADLAVRTGPPGQDDLLMRRVAEAGWSLYASPAYLADAPAWPGDPAGHRVIGFHADLAGSAAAHWLTAHLGEARVVLRLSAMTEMLATAREGVGLALLPCVLGDAEPGLNRLAPGVVVRQPVALVCRKDVAGTPEGRAVIGVLSRALKAARPALSGGEAHG